MRSANYAPPYSDADIGDVLGGELPRVLRSQPRGGYRRTRVVIACSEPIVRHGLRTLLATEAEFDVVAEAEDGASAVTLALRLRPDLVVIDLRMPRVDGLTATRMIRSEAADTHVVIMAGAHDDALTLKSIRAGASACLSRSMQTDVVVRTIQGASAGQVTLPLNAVMRPARARERHDALSERELDVLRLVAQGLANKRIARELGIAQSTVKSHIGSILGKLGLESRTQIALYATRTGLVALGEGEATDVQPTPSVARVASTPSARPVQFAAWSPATPA